MSWCASSRRTASVRSRTCAAFPARVAAPTSPARLCRTACRRAASPTSGFRGWADTAGAPPSYWRVAAFAAYADHLRSAEFRAGWDELCAALAERPTAIMCAEATPYRCHRRLISDWAELHGIEVVHLIDDRRSERHHLTAAARRAGDDVVYETSPQLDLGIGE